MYAVTYLINNIACLVILSVLFHRNNSSLNHGTGARLFQSLIVAVMFYVLLDLLAGLQENDAIILSHTMAGLLNILFFDASYLVSYLAFLYGEYQIESGILSNAKKTALVSIPLILLLFITPLTLRYHFFFYIDEGGNYVKGPLYAVLLLGAYGYIMAMGIRALYKGTKKKNYVLHDRITSLSTFVIFPLLAGFLQAMFTGISIICLGGTIALIQESLSSLDAMITTDSLTHINNRTTLVQYLDRMIAESHNGDSHCRKIFLLWMDMDNFKQLNDTLGHLEGDRALIQFANVLKLTADGYNSLIARYGGDEFCALLKVSDETEKDRFIEELNRNMKKPDIVDPKYHLSTSIGCVEYDTSIQNIPDFLRIADHELYRIKKEKKAGLS